MVMAFAIWLVERGLGITQPRLVMLILFGLNLVIGYLVFFLLDRGILVRGSYRPASAAGQGAA
jgi:hypothetical protein